MDRLPRWRTYDYDGHQYNVADDPVGGFAAV
jgi:hypothetical protein